MRVCLFGNLVLTAAGDDAPVPLEAAKAQELFAYLLLHRGRHHRELLAGVLWADQPAARARQYLRKTLWQLQSTLNAGPHCPEDGVLRVDGEDVAINEDAVLWVDVASFESACNGARGVPGRQLETAAAAALRSAVALYRGELLESWYHDWCLVERERFQLMYLSALDKLVGYCEAHGEYEAGLDYGLSILRCDRAREYTHRALMRLHFLAGDRTGALRQFERCCAALREELDVAPSAKTVALYERVRDGAGPADAEPSPALPVPPGAAGGQGLLPKLRQLRSLLQSIERQLAHEIETLDQAHRR